MDYQWQSAGQRLHTTAFQDSTNSFQLPDSCNPKLTIMGLEKNWSDLGEGVSGFWSSCTAEEQDAVPEIASGGSSEAQEDSTLSAYDNLRSTSPCQGEERVTEQHLEGTDTGGHIGTSEEQAGHKKDSSSWSSCEDLPLEDSADAVNSLRLEISPKEHERLHSDREANVEYSHKEDFGDDEEEEDGDGGEDNIYCLNSCISCSLPSDSPLSTGSSDVFLPSGPLDLQGPEPQSQSIHAQSLLVKLQQQMSQQKAEYEVKIQR